MKRTLLLLFLVFTASMARAQDLDLLVQHRIKVLGIDGIARTTEFSERMVRRHDQVWVERVVPEAALAGRPIPVKAAHEQFNVAGAARWVSLGPDRRLRLTLVDASEKLMIDVDVPDFGNVGFDGSWDGAYFLLDPKALAGMAKRGARLADGGQWYERRRPGGSVKVLWDETLKFPRVVETVNGNGIDTRSMQAARTARGRNLPWEATRGFDRKGYNDLLD